MDLVGSGFWMGLRMGELVLGRCAVSYRGKVFGLGSKKVGLLLVLDWSGFGILVRGGVWRRLLGVAMIYVGEDEKGYGREHRGRRRLCLCLMTNR